MISIKQIWLQKKKKKSSTAQDKGTDTNSLFSFFFFSLLKTLIPHCDLDPEGSKIIFPHHTLDYHNAPSHTVSLQTVKLFRRYRPDKITSDR